jgi:predicted nucleic acid-binding protein
VIVVADATPVQYLVRIKAVNVLLPLYHRVLVPQSVARELQQNNTPAAVRAWIAQPPAWCEVRPDPPADPTLAFLDAGERAAIALAESVAADRLLMDERQGRTEAKRRHLPVTGTLGVVADAHVAGLLDFEKAIFQLRQTNFYVTDEVVARVRQQIAGAKGHP